MDENQNHVEQTATPNAEVVPQTAPATNQNSSADTQSSFEFNETTIMAALSYFGPLVIIPYLTKKENPFVMFHIKQGIVVLVPYIALWVLGGFMYWLWPIMKIAELALLILSIIGIVNAVQKKEKELPFIGKFASHIKL